MDAPKTVEDWVLVYDKEGNMRLKKPGAKNCIHGKPMSVLKTMGTAICHLCRHEAEVLARRQTERKEIT